MRIVHVVQRFHPEIGGAETYVREIAQEQARRGHDVVVATTLPKGAPAEEVMGGVRVVRFPTRRRRGDYLFPPWLPMEGAAAFLARSRADLLHAHSYRFHTLEVAASASRRTGIPLVVSALGFYPPENRLVALSRLAYDPFRGRRALAQAERCIALTHDEIKYHAALGVPADRVDVVPPGIHRLAFEPGDGAGFRKRHDLAGPLVVFLARLGHDKGVRDLVRAAAVVPGATFAFCGRDAGERRPAERLARRLGCADRVRFLGGVPEPRDAYAAADVFCHPSHYESFGLVLLEAMAQGRPVVATTAGGMPEVVGDSGVLVAPRRPAQLAEALASLLADEPRRRLLAARGRHRAKGFLWGAMIDRLEETYRRAVAPDARLHPGIARPRSGR